MSPPLLRERIPTIPSEVEQVVLRALAKDSKARFASVADFAAALEQASQRVLTPTAQLASEQPALSQAAAMSYDTVAVAPNEPAQPIETTPSADLPVAALEPTVYPDSSTPLGLDTPPSETPQSGQMLAPKAAVVSPPLEPTMPAHPKARRVSRTVAGLLIGLAVLVVAAGILGSVSLLAHFGVIGTHSSASTAAVRGGTWTDEIIRDPDSLIPNNGDMGSFAGEVDQALYLPLFYSDAQGFMYPGAATEVPSLKNGGISVDAKTWTFHLKPHLAWSDGAAYDARDVDFTWKLWANPKFGIPSPLGLTLISSAEVSADHLSITFHLKQPFAPFLALWVDGFQAPLPTHHFSQVAPETIFKSPENLNPQVVSGPFMMAESLPGDHYTLVRNPRYYRVGEGLPYLDKVIFRVGASGDAILKDLQAGALDSAWFLDLEKWQEYQRDKSYTLVTSPATANFEAMYFNFHNTVLANHPEVRQAMTMAIDQQTLIQQARHGFASPLCTDHPNIFHLGNFAVLCPELNLDAANKLLEDNGWVKGPDGVRAKGNQRLEFEYSTTDNIIWRLEDESIIKRNFQAIGIKLDIQNYSNPTFFGPFLSGGKASLLTGAIAGRYDIAEWLNGFNYDPDDSSVLACDQFPPQGQNYTFYCNPALDALYRQEQSTVDPGVRQQVFFQIHQFYLTEIPFIVLSSTLDLAMVHKGTHNYQISPFDGGTINIWEWWCDGGSVREPSPSRGRSPRLGSAYHFFGEEARILGQIGKRMKISHLQAKYSQSSHSLATLPVGAKAMTEGTHRAYFLIIPHYPS
jgi:peptide/nickel transport system substrate-binding protein